MIGGNLMKTSDISVEYIQHCGSDLSVVNAARVSFNKESKEFVSKDEGLINYLAKHKHFSPFNHSFITLRIKAPIFVARQLVKHKFMPWNEVSRRYVDDEPEFFFPDYWRKKADNVKQGSSEESVELTDMWYNSAKVGSENSLAWYKSAIDEGICAEQARMMLPQNMMVEWFWSGTLGAYCDMLRLRLDPHTQKESRIVAEKIRGIIEPLFPVSVKALLSV